MKLLAWMHQKLCRSSNDQIKNFNGKTSSLYSAQQGKESGMEDALKDDLFHGFLTIGTLGSDPPTPTFPPPIQDIKTEMDLVNCKLDKFLSADATQGLVDDLSSPRSSISLSGITDSDDFPLEKYLSGTGLVETAFKYDEDHRTKKHKQSYAMRRFARKVLKKLLHSTYNATKSGAIKRKLPKVPKLKLFPRKVHPDQDFIVHLPDTVKESFDSVPNSETIYESGQAEDRERWITTEDDYLILELQNGCPYKAPGYVF